MAKSKANYEMETVPEPPTGPSGVSSSTVNYLSSDVATVQERALDFAILFYAAGIYELPEIRKEDHTLYTPAERLVREAKVIQAYLQPEED